MELQRPSVHWRALVPAEEQARLQAPQWSTLVSTCVSQPSSAAGAEGVVQFPRPTAHELVQTPPAQRRDTVPVAEHARPQPPQCRMLVERFVSQPVRGSPSQSSNPGLQLTISHLPPLQRPVPFTGWHALLQNPQC